MYCKKCGEKIDNNNRICKACGTFYSVTDEKTTREMENTRMVYTQYRDMLKYKMIYQLLAIPTVFVIFAPYVLFLFNLPLIICIMAAISAVTFLYGVVKLRLKYRCPACRSIFPIKMNHITTTYCPYCGERLQ